MASDSDVAVPTQQSTKKYVDDQIAAIPAPISDGWNVYSAVVPTRVSADDPTYVITFAAVDLTSILSVGMKIKWTQNGTIRYGFITAIAFSTNTTVTIYGGTDYDVDDTATHVISGFYYSTHRSPLSFPMSPDKWTVENANSSNASQSSPTNSTFYNLGSLQLVVPIGLWKLSWSGKIEAQKNSSTVVDIFATLSTSASAETNDKLTAVEGFIGASGNLLAGDMVYREDIVTAASKTTYYLIAKTDNAVSTISFKGVAAATVIRAECVYL